jgi:hypothetical protein
MSDPAPGPVDAFGGLFVLAFQLLDSEVGKAPERVVDVFKNPKLIGAAQTAMLKFAKERDPGASSMVTPEEFAKLRDSVVDGVKSAATEEYLKQIKASSKFKALEGQLDSFEKAFNSSALGVWIDENEGYLYVVGAALALGAGVAMYVTKPSGPVMELATKELAKLKFKIVKVGSLQLGVGGITFEPKSDLVGAKLTGTINWQKLKIDLAFQLIAKGPTVQEIGGDVAVKYGAIDLSGMIKKDMTKPTVDVTVRLNVTADRFSIGVGGQMKDGVFGANAGASYKLTESLKITADYNNRQRKDMNDVQENVVIIGIGGRFP